MSAIYGHVVRVQSFPTAQLLLQLWERPWSTTALRHAHHRIRTLYRMGLDVLDVGCGRAR